MIDGFSANGLANNPLEPRQDGDVGKNRASTGRAPAFADTCDKDRQVRMTGWAVQNSYWGHRCYIATRTEAFRATKGRVGRVGAKCM